MILNKHNLKNCNRCKAKKEIKTYAIMRHFPFYDYESFYLCDKCFEELEKQLKNFFDYDKDFYEPPKEDKLIELRTCWYCGLQNDKKVMEDYEHEGFLFCDDKCIKEYIKAERKRQEKADKDITKICESQK